MYYVAAIAWEQNRREWIGDRSRRSKRIQKDPIIRYMLSTASLVIPSPFRRKICSYINVLGSILLGTKHNSNSF